MSRLFLHIGYPKAGSSALQTSLLASRKALDERGFFFPYTPDGLCNAFVAQFHPTPASLHPYGSIENERRRERVIARDIEQLSNRLGLARGKSVILSSESLIGLDRDAVLAVHQWTATRFEAVTILCYVREPVSYATSLTQERVKQGLGLAEAVEQTPTGNYSVSIPRWTDAFGKRNVVVRSIEALAGNDVVSNFARVIGYDGPLDRTGYANVAMSEEATRLIGAIHERARRSDRRPVAPSWLRGIPGRAFRLPDEMIDRICVQATSGLAYLQSEWDITFEPAAPEIRREAFSELTLAFLAEHIAEA